jgi:hypothetical protein
MRRIPRVLASFALSVTFGCGEQASNLHLTPPPSGGAMVRLPGNRGFVAIKTESPVATRGVKTKNRAASIVAFFYQIDGVTPMTPAPTDVIFKLGVNGDATPVALSPDSKDANRFASSPGPYSRGIQGTVHAKIDGEDVEESFSSL